MAILKYDTGSLNYMRLFKQMTNVTPLGCIALDSALVFLTDKSQAGIAVGKQGVNIKRLRTTFNRNIFIVGSAAEPLELVRNFCHTAELSVSYQDESQSVIEIKFTSQKDRRNFLANEQLRLKVLKSIVLKQAPHVRNIVVPLIR